jgi:hypothetical protein
VPLEVGSYVESCLRLEFQGVGVEGKAVLMAASDMVAVAFDFLRFCLGLMTVKSSSPSMAFRCGCSLAAPADDGGSCAPCLVTVVPPWEQCTSAVTVMFWLPEGHATGEADLAGSGTGRVLLSAHIDPSSESTNYRDRRVCLGSLVSLVILSVSLSLSDLCFMAFLGFFTAACRASSILPCWQLGLLTKTERTRKMIILIFGTGYGRKRNMK